MTLLQADNHPSHRAIFEKHENEWWGLCMACYREVTIPRSGSDDDVEIRRVMERLLCPAADYALGG